MLETTVRYDGQVRQLGWASGSGAEQADCDFEVVVESRRGGFLQIVVSAFCLFRCVRSVVDSAFR